MGVEIRARIVGDHEQLLGAAGEHVLLQLGFVDRFRADGGDHDLIAVACELGSGFERVEIVGGYGVLRLGIVERTVAGDLDILIVRHDLECNDDVHTMSPFKYLRVLVGSKTLPL